MSVLPYLATNYSPSAIALVAPDGTTVSYAELVRSANDWTSRVSHEHKQLIFFYVPRTQESIACLLGLLHSGHVVALLDPELKPQARQELESLYEPWACVSPEGDGAGSLQLSLSKQNERDEASAVHPDVSLMLSTSGSTGSPKFAKLSRSAVLANVLDISNVLKITAADRGLAHLDFHYSYGLSVVTSHLAVGASLGFPTGKFTDRTFWDDLRKLEATHLPGVPFHYEMMNRLGIKRLKIPSVTVMTQAGGRLASNSQKQVYEYMESVGGRFYVMYGQTEAAPRMSTLPHEKFLEKFGSVGPVLPSGEFSIISEDGTTCAPKEVGEVSYHGANVMMGYAFSADDLLAGDENGGTLRTGDLGCLDHDGFLTIMGRANRMGKVFGWRVNLDELEKAVEEFGCAAVLQKDDAITIVSLVGTEPDLVAVRKLIAERFTLPLNVFSFKQAAEIPKTRRNKTDYAALEGLL